MRRGAAPLVPTDGDMDAYLEGEGIYGSSTFSSPPGAQERGRHLHPPFLRAEEAPGKGLRPTALTAEIRAASDPQALFDEKMNARSD